MPEPKGYLAIVLHAHLPWVRRSDGGDSVEERWLHEAITETYLPLLDLFDGLGRSGVPFRLSLSLSPTLLGMLEDSLLQNRYVRHLERLIRFVEEELQRLRDEPAFLRVAVLYRDSLQRAQRSFCDRHRGNLIPAFRQLQEEGVLDLFACPATHGYLPMLAVNPKFVEAQVRIGIDEHLRHFGQEPLGLWLPECGFSPELDPILARHGVRLVVVEDHALAFANPRPWLGTYAPVLTPGGTAALARDPTTSRQVWSATDGYPADPDYRDFHRDAGFDLPREKLRTFLGSTGVRAPTGIKYHRITGPGDHKEPYDPDRARQKAAAHASHFLSACTRRAREVMPSIGRPPLLVAAYDAELFGHWWFEGPQWLGFLVRKVAYDQSELALETPATHLARFPVVQEAMPATSSWGQGGYHTVWLSGENDWIYRHLDRAGARMSELAGRFPDARGFELRALNQCARELLLSQSSDWAFMMSRGTFAEYAIRRVREHLAHFTELADALVARQVDPAMLADLEARNPVFPAMDYRVFR